VALALLLGFLLVIFIGVPIGFAMGFITIASFHVLGGNLIIIPQRLFSGMDNFTFLAIPLFILAAEIMSKGNLIDRIIRFNVSLFGHIPGGLAIVNVMNSVLFAGISGSASADVSALGKIQIEMMEKAGYPRNYAGAVTAASAIVTPIKPPSGIMIIYAVIAGNVSVAAMFVGGFLPAYSLAAIYMVFCYYLAKMRNHPKSPQRARGIDIWDAFKKAVPVLGCPFIIMGGIMTGVFTATESAVIAVAYALFITKFVMKTLEWKALIGCCVRTAKLTANVLFIIAIATAMGWAITTLQIPQAIVNFSMNYIHSPIVFLLFTNIILIVVGAFMDVSPAMLIMTPILLPAALEFGIHPLHFGLLICINLTISLITPPVGMTLFITSNVGRIKLSSLYKETLPFAAVAYIMLMIVTFLPGFTLFLPRLFGYV